MYILVQKVPKCLLICSWTPWSQCEKEYTRQHILKYSSWRKRSSIGVVGLHWSVMRMQLLVRSWEVIVQYSSQRCLRSWIGVQRQNFVIRPLRVARYFSRQLFVIIETRVIWNSQKVLYYSRDMFYIWMHLVIWGAVVPVASGGDCPGSASGMNEISFSDSVL